MRMASRLEKVTKIIRKAVFVYQPIKFEGERVLGWEYLFTCDRAGTGVLCAPKLSSFSI